MGTIPNNVKELYASLREETIWLHSKWKIYNQLFGKSQLRVDLLNETAQVFFSVIQSTLLDEVVISIGRLTDSAETGKHKNLSLEQLFKKMHPIIEPGFKTDLQVAINRVREKCEAFRHHRNKRLAHFDLSYKLKSLTELLPGITVEMIEAALKRIADFMNAIEIFYTEAETAYEHIITEHDGESLMLFLKKGLRYQELISENKIKVNDRYESRWMDA